MPDDADFIPRTPPVPGPPEPGDAPDMHAHHRPGHEHSDVNVRGLAYFFVAVALSAIAGHWFLESIFEGFTGRTLQVHPPRIDPRLKTGFSTDPEPRLEVVPADDLRRLREYEQHQLDTCGWVDRATGTVHIPIEQAIKQTAQRLSKPERRPP